MSLRWRLALRSLTILGATLLGVTGLTYVVLRQTFRRDAVGHATARAAQICTILAQEDFDEASERAARRGPGSSPVLESGMGGADELLLSSGALAAFGLDGALIRIRDGSGHRIGAAALRLVASSAVGGGSAIDPGRDAGEVVIASRQVPLRCSQFPQPITVSVGWPLAPAYDRLSRLALMLAGLGGLALLLAGISTITLVRGALAPLERLSRQADAYSIGDLSRRLPGDEGTDEVGRLVVAFNRLLSRLESAFDRERRFTSDAAHELRTPLTILRGEVELALRHHPDAPDPIRRGLLSLKEEIERLETLVANLLALARSESAETALDAEPVSLLELCSEVVGRLARPARALGVTLAIDPESTDLTVLGDSATLRQALVNIVQNGVRHAPPGTTVRARVYRGTAAVLSGAQAVIEVQDAGPGIPEEALPRLFDRFFRVETGRTRLSDRGHGQGHGLGLAITRAVVEAHGGTVRAENLPAGGARFTITLPVQE